MDAAMTEGEEQKIARAEKRSPKVKAQTARAAEATAEHEADITAGDANTALMKRLRLAMNEPVRAASETDPAKQKIHKLAPR